MDINSIIRKLPSTLTQEEKDFYKAHGMGDYEKKIGVPYFDFTDEQYLGQVVYDYNNQEGHLKGYNCPLCHNKGEIQRVVGNTIYSSVCRCMTVRKSLAMVEELGLKEEFKNYRISKYKCNHEWQAQAVDKVIEFKSSESKFMAFLGESGAGKTHLAIALLRQYVKEFKSIAYMRWVEDSRALKANSTESAEFAKLIEPYKKAQVLYIDDLFKSNPTQADLALAFEIIDYRYKLSVGGEYITIISSEKTFNDLYRLDKAITGRIAERSNNMEFVVEFKGSEKNYRLSMKNT